MKTSELINLLAILLGPILAVAVQLISEGRRKTHEQQTQTMRMLLSTRHMPSDPVYSTAINMIPIDFNKSKRVMQAHKAYIECITYQPSSENVETHNQQIISKQTKLIFEMARHLKYDLPETDIQTSAYAAGGFIARDNLMLDAWRSWPRIAEALENNNKIYLATLGDSEQNEENAQKN
tara:strand:+ start:554 stop:1090 length:537 start_codon:yes stop_codon:yes gene_type:complete